MMVRVTVPLTSPGDPTRGHGPRIIPGLYPEDQIRDWLNCYGRLSEANYAFAMAEGWIEEVQP